MKEEKKDGLQVALADEPKQVSLDELDAKIEELRILTEGLASGGTPPPTRQKGTGAQEILDAAEREYNPPQLEQAENWIRRQMGGRLEVRPGPGIDGRSADEIIFLDIKSVTQNHRDLGLTQLPEKWGFCRNAPVPALARYYAKIILDEGSYGSDEEKLRAVVDDSNKRRTHVGEFPFLFIGAEEGKRITSKSELKPLKRSRTRKRKS